MLKPSRVLEATQGIGSLRYLFEEYAFDTDRRELHRGSEVVSIAPQVFDLLDYLIRNRERVVSKDDLINAIWNGRIVSDAALTTRLNVARSVIGDSGEEQHLIKTLPRKGFRFVGTVREAQKPEGAADTDNRVEPPKPTLLLPDKPSIAVLPFTNLSSDPEQEYFAEGVVEDITMALSLFRWLFVIERNSSFTYKGRTVDVKQVGRELGVRYVLQGSVRKAGNRMRIAGQLIDAETGAHLWADRFEGALKDMFDLQDHLTSSVVGAIAPKLQHEEIKRARRKPTENLNAYDYYLRGLAKLRRWTKDANSEALQLFCKAIELDPRFASAYGMAAWCYVQRKARGWMIEHVQESAEATRLAGKAVHLGGDDPVALCMGGYALAYVAHEFDDAAAFMDRGLVVNPNLAQGWTLSGWLRVWRGEPELALEHVAHAMRLSPLDPSMYGMHGAMAYAHFLASRYGPASSWTEKSMRENPNFLLAMCMSAASNALAGRLEHAQRGMARALECDPDLHASNLKELTPFRRAKDLAAFAKGLRKAGLPE
jgi:TolB-like protein